MLGQKFLKFCMADFLYGHYPHMEGSHLSHTLHEFCRNPTDEELLEIGKRYQSLGVKSAREYVVETFSKRKIDIADVLRSENAIVDLQELVKANKIKPNYGPPKYLRQSNGAWKVTVNDWLIGIGSPQEDVKVGKTEAAQNALDLFYSFYDPKPTPLSMHMK
jgi:dsRNA-specific ribonuclease